MRLEDARKRYSPEDIAAREEQARQEETRKLEEERLREERERKPLGGFDPGGDGVRVELVNLHVEAGPESSTFDPRTMGRISSPPTGTALFKIHIPETLLAINDPTLVGSPMEFCKRLLARAIGESGPMTWLLERVEQELSDFNRNVIVSCVVRVAPEFVERISIYACAQVSRIGGLGGPR